MMVAQRRKLLDYLKRKDEARCTTLIGAVVAAPPNAMLFMVSMIGGERICG